MPAENVIAICPVFVEIFQSEPIGHQTDHSSHAASFCIYAAFMSYGKKLMMGKVDPALNSRSMEILLFLRLMCIYVECQKAVGTVEL